MFITRIPERFQPGFAKIKKLLPRDVEALIAALENASVTGGLKEMTSAVVKQVPSLKKDEVEDILKTLYSLYIFRADDDTPLPGFLSEVASAMQATGKSELALPEQEKTEFENRMSRLLSLSTVTISSKVDRLKIEYPNTFHDARILTDIRPIFAKPEDRPVGGAIAHTLKIEYHEGGEHKEFYVALDVDDVQKLKKILERAESKTSSLKALLKAAGLLDLS